MEDFDLIKIFESMKANGISELIIKKGRKKYEVRRGGFKNNAPTSTQPTVQNVPAANQPVVHYFQEQGTSPGHHIEKMVSDKPAEKENVKAVDNKSSLYELKSPLVGTFYGAPKPDTPPFVEVGDKVKKGQTLCIVEAMKNFNEIECEVDGIIEEICVKSEELVEFGKVLFRIKLA